MTIDVSSNRRYRRSGALSWRDTGRHVLVAPMDKIASVMVLGGGGAMLWRLLEEPDTAHGLTQRLARVEGAPDLSAVAECLDDLTGRGVLSLDRPGASP